LQGRRKQADARGFAGLQPRLTEQKRRVKKAPEKRQEEMTPKRIQRRRTKGWKMPPGTVYVGRPTKYGNPFKIGDPHPVFSVPMDAEDVCKMYEWGMVNVKPDLSELRGKNLACWCKEGDPCHADVLLRLANEAKP
jgi:hypothetical protein